MADITQHWLVQAIDAIAPASWDRIVSEPEAVVFALTTPSSADWPATVSIVPVADDEWPSEQAFDAEPEVGLVRLARETSIGRAIAHIDVQVDGALRGCPLAVDIWFDTMPRLHLAAAGTGADLYELGYFYDAITALADPFEAGAAPAPTTQTVVAPS